MKCPKHLFVIRLRQPLSFLPLLSKQTIDCIRSSSSSCAERERPQQVFREVLHPLMMFRVLWVFHVLRVFCVFVCFGKDLLVLFAELLLLVVRKVSEDCVRL